jgi:hypothetical protein
MSCIGVDPEAPICNAPVPILDLAARHVAFRQKVAAQTVLYVKNVFNGEARHHVHGIRQSRCNGWASPGALRPGVLGEE